MPHKRDTDGLSVYREKYHSIEEVATTLRGAGTQPCWVVVLLARDLMEEALTPVPRPMPAEGVLPARPGHAVIPDLKATAGRKLDPADPIYRRLADLVVEVSRAFDPPTRAR